MTIRKRKDRDGWLVQVEVNGERKRRQVGDKWEATRVEQEMRKALREGRPHLGLEEAMTAYQHTLRVRGKRTSVRSADFHGRALERHLGSHFNVAELNQRDVDGLVQGLREGGWKTASINGALRILRAALKYAQQEGRLTAAPPVKMLRENRPIPTILTVAELDRLVACAPTERARLCILIAAHTGLRHQEILHLTAADCQNGEVRVTAKHGWSPKAHYERAVPMNRTLAAALEPVVRDRVGWLFPNTQSQPIESMAPEVRAAYKAAGLWEADGNTGLHKLRRTWASRLLASGASLVTVMEMGGWTSLESVQRYLSSSTDQKRRAVAALEG